MPKGIYPRVALSHAANKPKRAAKKKAVTSRGRGKRGTTIRTAIPTEAWRDLFRQSNAAIADIAKADATKGDLNSEGVSEAVMAAMTGMGWHQAATIPLAELSLDTAKLAVASLREAYAYYVKELATSRRQAEAWKSMLSWHVDNLGLPADSAG